MRILDILIVFPDDEDSWRACERLMRARLAQHRLQFVTRIDQAASHVASAEVVLSFTFSEALAQQATRLRWIQGLGAGVESLLPLTRTRPQLIVTNMRGIHTVPVSEAALGLMFALSRQLPRNVRNQDAQRWGPFSSQLLHGRTAGILGVGAIAEGLAQRCRALGMRVVGISGARRQAPGFDELRPRADLLRAVADMDYLVLLLPLTPDTRGIVDGAVLQAMKPGAYLINVGRGPLIDEAALLQALRSGHIAGAALDTVVHEPLAAGAQLWTAQNVLITPHNAGRHEGYCADALRIFEHNVECYLRGDLAAMWNRIHPPVADVPDAGTGLDAGIGAAARQPGRNLP